MTSQTRDSRAYHWPLVGRSSISRRSGESARSAVKYREFPSHFRGSMGFAIETMTVQVEYKGGASSTTSDDTKLLLASLTNSSLVLGTLSLEDMKICYLFFALLIGIVSYGRAHKRHLHLRIYVPDIVNHHVHTKTIYIRLQKPKKKPKTQHKEHHHENWSSWSYGHHHDYNDEHDHEDHEDLSDRERLEMEEPRNHPKQHAHPDDSYFPQTYVDDNNLEPDPRGRDHNQYAVHENVKDIPPNSESLLYNYEEGYRKGLETESGHVRTGQTSKFHTDQHEEQDDDEAEGSKEDFSGKTHSGRYLVDDVEYENARDKRQGGRRLRRIKKV